VLNRTCADRRPLEGHHPELQERARIGSLSGECRRGATLGGLVGAAGEVVVAGVAHGEGRGRVVIKDEIGSDGDDGEIDDEVSSFCRGEQDVEGAIGIKPSEGSPRSLVRP